MSALPQVTPRIGFRFMLSIRKGADAGSQFQLLPPRVTIGRDPENNIVLHDPRVSRQALVIEFKPEEIVATDTSGKTGLALNGVSSARASIRDGDILTIGDTELLFIVEAMQLPPVPHSIGPSASATPARLHSVGALATPPLGLGPLVPPLTPPFSQPFHPPPPRAAHAAHARTSPTPEASRKIVFYAMVALLIGGAAWLLSGNKAVKHNDPTLRTDSVVEKEIELSNSRVDEVLKKRAFRSDEERTRFEEAQKHYLEGFRDYQKGQWIRAYKSFETARAIDPDHELARRYSQLAEKHRDEMIALLTLSGRQFKEKQMYSRCSAAFEKVLDAIANKDDVKYKQAEAMKTECDVMLNGRYQ